MSIVKEWLSARRRRKAAKVRLDAALEQCKKPEVIALVSEKRLSRTLEMERIRLSQLPLGGGDA